MLSSLEGRLLAHPHPRTRGLLEIRNLGIISFPVCLQAEIALVVTLDEAAARHVEAPGLAMRGGVELPAIALWPGSSALKVEHALRLYGLSV